MAAHQNVLVLWDSVEKRGEIWVTDSNYNRVTTATMGRGSFAPEWTMVASIAPPRALFIG